MSDPNKPATPAPNEITPGPGIPAPHVAANAPAGTPPAPEAKPDQPFAVFPTAEAFKERLEREAKRQAAELLGVAPDEAKKRLDKLAKLEAEEEERKKASLSEVERAKAEAEEAKKKQADAEAEVARARADAENARAMAKHGVTNEGYAAYLLEQERTKAKAAGVAFDAAAALETLIKDPAHAAALRPAGGPPKVVAADTSTGGNRSEGTPVVEKPKDAFDDEVWKKRKAELGI